MTEGNDRPRSSGSSRPSAPRGSNGSGGRPGGAGRPSGSGRPGGSGKPGSGSRPSDSGRSSGPGGPNGSRKPGGSGSTGGSGRPSGTDRPARSDGPTKPRVASPAIDADVSGTELDRPVLAELRTLPTDLAEAVAKHLIMIGRLLEDDPERAWEHGKAATRLASRVAMVREASGFAAYRCGEYAIALSDLRAARRMSGDNSMLPIIADCERALDRPLRAIELAGSADADGLDRDGRVELRIVAAGARADLGQFEAALVTLQCPELTAKAQTPWAARLRYAYAEALLRLGRDSEALDWFGRAADADLDFETDAAERAGRISQSGVEDEDIVFFDE